jgi:hypothetical protein
MLFDRMIRLMMDILADNNKRRRLPHRRPKSQMLHMQLLLEPSINNNDLHYLEK